MPQLKSCRHVCVSASPILDAINSDKKGRMFNAMLDYRLAASSPEQLRHHLAVGFLREGEGEPPNAPSYASGLSVGDVLAGNTDLAPEEVEEFRAWLETHPTLDAWVKEQFDEISAAIKAIAIWALSLWKEE